MTKADEMKLWREMNQKPARSNAEQKRLDQISSKEPGELPMTDMRMKPVPVFATPTHGPEIDWEAKKKTFLEEWGKENVDWSKDCSDCHPRKSLHTQPIPSDEDIKKASLMIYSH